LRRLLNRGLFTAGVVSGLEVGAITGEVRKVRVKHGVALDPLGREIVLEQDTIVDVPDQPPTANLGGYFLVIAYAEEQLPAVDPWCGTPEPPPRPARVREEPLLEWTESPPAHALCTAGAGIDCGVLLALVGLDASCRVQTVEIGFREYAHPTHVSQAHAIAFEGEKDVDAANPKVLHFEIRGGAPQSVLLYLWGGQFSSLYYSELGRHTHAFDKQTGPATTSLAGHTHSLSGHTHTIPEGTTASPDPAVQPKDGAHNHVLWVELPGSGAFPPHPGREGTVTTHQPLGPPLGAGGSEYAPRGGAGQDYVRGGEHSHAVAFHDAAGNTTDQTIGPSANVTGPSQPSTGDGTETHRHAIPDTVFAGVANGPARTGPNEFAHTYLNGLRVALDEQDITPQILARYVPSTWRTLGDGSQGHPLNQPDGTGAIDLLEIAPAVKVDLGEGSHRIELSVTGGGGKVLYNLYVA
jgi:hypothetical protein